MTWERERGRVESTIGGQKSRYKGLLTIKVLGDTFSMGSSVFVTMASMQQKARGLLAANMPPSGAKVHWHTKQRWRMSSLGLQFCGDVAHGRVTLHCYKRLTQFDS